MTKSNTVQHQNMSKTRHQNGTKKNNSTSSQMLLDHCYTFGLLLWPSNSEEVVLWRRALIGLLYMALPWIHHCADLAQQSIQMCGSHEYSQMLVDDCYAFLIVALAFHSEGEVLWRRGPSLTYYGPALDLPLKRIWPKSEYKWSGSWVLYPYKVLWISIKWFCS